MPREPEVFTQVDFIHERFQKWNKGERAAFVFGMELASDLVRALVSDLQHKLEQEEDRDDL